MIKPAMTGLLLAALSVCAHALPTYEEVKSAYRSSDTLVLDRNGEVLQRLRTDATVRRGQWVPLADVSPALRTAMLLSEDKRFYEHSGVDWRAASAAAWGNLWNSRTRGASTITMQLAGLLDEDLQRAPGGRSVVQKLGQTVAAQVLDRRWRKDQILEAYLNVVPFRSELVGIDALSRTLFGKAAHGLDEREAAIAAVLVRAPNARPAQVAQRACGVLAEMGRIGAAPRSGKTTGKAVVAAKPDCEGLDLFATAALQRKAFEANEGIAPHLARRLIAGRAPSPQPSPGGRGSEPPAPALGRGGEVPKASKAVRLPLPLGEGGGEGAPRTEAREVRSTLRAPLQRYALQSLEQQLRELRGRNVEDGAIVVLDNASGEVLAWVGSSGALSAAGEVDGVTALRQPGSTLKPFLYAQAIAEKRLTAASLLEDSPAHIPTASGLYIPQNYDRQFKGWVSARTALGASLNVPAVRTLVMVSPDAFARQLRAVGLPLKEAGDYYGYSLALGSAEVSLLNLTNAYRTLANGGRFGEVSYIARPLLHSSQHSAQYPSQRSSDAKPSKPAAIDPRAAFIVGDILADPNARARTFGTDSLLATRFWTAVKTGTSKDMRDNWAVGWSQRYTVGVWMGNASGAAMHDVSGTTGAAPIWAAVMQYLHRHEPSRAPAAPAGLVQANAKFGGQLEAARPEWFLPGTQQTLFALDSTEGGNQGMAVAGHKSAKPEKTAPPAQADSGPAARITAPAPGTIVALDPDIPPTRQRLRFTASGSNLRWQMDGKPFGQGAQLQWLPWPGKHVVQLVDARGKVLDEVRIEVRGAGVKAAAR